MKMVERWFAVVSSVEVRASSSTFGGGRSVTAKNVLRS